MFASLMFIFCHVYIFLGLNKSHKWSGTDISLIIILAFCSLVIVFIGYTCCRRRRAKRKKKSEQRKIVKGGRRPENVELLGSSQQSSESLDVSGYQWRKFTFSGGGEGGKAS